MPGLKDIDVLTTVPWLFRGFKVIIPEAACEHFLAMSAEPEPCWDSIQEEPPVAIIIHCGVNNFGDPKWNEEKDHVKG